MGVILDDPNSAKGDIRWLYFIVLYGLFSRSGDNRKTDHSAASRQSGMASGLDSWSVSGISLANGGNNITVTAIDEAGNTGYALLSVVCQVGARK